MRKKVIITSYRLVKQFKMKGALHPEEAGKLGTKWSNEGYAVEITIEERKGGDESFSAADITYLVEAERTVVEIDELEIAILQKKLK